MLDDVSWQAPLGSFYGLIGISGAGKTTTFRILTGLTRPSAGTVQVLGRSPRELHRARGDVGALLDRSGWEPHLTAEQNLRLALIRNGGPSENSAELMERLGLAPLRKKRLARLSQGERQRLGIVRALAASPRLAVLDEPLVHLDPWSVDRVLELLNEYREQRGMTVLMSSHHLAQIENVVTDVALIHRGRVIRQGSRRSLWRANGIRYKLTVRPLTAAHKALQEHPWVTDVRRLESRQENDPNLLMSLDRDEPATINAHLHQLGLQVGTLTPAQPTLEETLREAIRAESGS